MASHSLKTPKRLTWPERSASLAIFLFLAHQALSHPRTFSHAILPIGSVLPAFHMPCYIAYPSFRSQPKPHVLSFLIALFTASPSCLFLTSDAFCHILLCFFYSAYSVGLFIICLPPLEWHSLNLTLCNSPLSPGCLDQGPPCLDTQSLFGRC